jgi:hypothetical protein
MADDDFKFMQPPDGEPVSPPSKPVVAAAAPLDQKLPYEEWARRGGVEHWRADVARHCRAWPLGQEVTESEFNQALHDAFNSRIG